MRVDDLLPHLGRECVRGLGDLLQQKTVPLNVLAEVLEQHFQPHGSRTLKVPRQALQVAGVVPALNLLVVLVVVRQLEGTPHRLRRPRHRARVPPLHSSLFSVRETTLSELLTA